MKLLITTLVAGTVATAAAADKGDRYNDLRLNTAVGHVTYAASASKAKRTTISTRNKADQKKVPYAYTNPYGVGPYNDSR